MTPLLHAQITSELGIPQDATCLSGIYAYYMCDKKGIHLDYLLRAMA